MLRNIFVMVLAALGLMACESEPDETSTGTVTSSGTSGGSSSGGTSGTSGGTGTANQGVLVHVYVPDVGGEGEWDGTWVKTDGVPVQVFEGLGAEYLADDTTHWNSGESGSVIPLPAYDDFIVTVGSMEKRAETNGWMPVYSADDGWLWIAPGVDLGSFAEGEVVEVDVYMNAFAEGTWSCVDDDDNINSGVVEYQNGDQITFADLSPLTLSGTLGNYSDSYDIECEFLSPNYAEMLVTGGLGGDYHLECWSGNASARP